MKIRADLPDGQISLQIFLRKMKRAGSLRQQNGPRRKTDFVSGFKSMRKFSLAVRKVAGVKPAE
jgi:hypothetical protein